MNDWTDLLLAIASVIRAITILVTKLKNRNIKLRRKRTR